MAGKKNNSEDTNSVDKAIEQQKASKIDQTVRDADKETKTRQPGAANGSRSNQHNNGRGGGK